MEPVVGRQDGHHGGVHRVRDLWEESLGRRLGKGVQEVPGERDSGRRTTDRDLHFLVLGNDLGVVRRSIYLVHLPERVVVATHDEAPLATSTLTLFPRRLQHGVLPGQERRLQRDHLRTRLIGQGKWNLKRPVPHPERPADILLLRRLAEDVRRHPELRPGEVVYKGQGKIINTGKPSRARKAPGAVLGFLHLVRRV